MTKVKLLSSVVHDLSVTTYDSNGPSLKNGESVETNYNCLILKILKDEQFHTPNGHTNAENQFVKQTIVRRIYEIYYHLS